MTLDRGLTAIGPSLTGGTSMIACHWCSNGPYQVYHAGPCPRVNSVEYWPNGTVKRVEFRGE